MAAVFPDHIGFLNFASIGGGTPALGNFSYFKGAPMAQGLLLFSEEPAGGKGQEGAD
jgi:hypothetical protein